MKHSVICILVVATVFWACTDSVSDIEAKYNAQTYTVQKYTAAELRQIGGGLTYIPFGEKFWDIFGRFEHYYTLTEDENKLLGYWTSFKSWSTIPSCTFFPNKLFLGSLVYDFVLKENNAVRIGSVIGTWAINNGKVKVTVHGFLTATERQVPEGKKYAHEYIFCTPYEVELIDMKDVDLLGYTLAAFNIVPVPAELRRRVQPVQRGINEPKLGRDQAAVQISATEYRKGGNQEHTYGWFNYFPLMTLRRLTGEQIAKSPELVMEIFFSKPWGYYEDLSQEYPEDFPDLGNWWEKREYW